VNMPRVIQKLESHRRAIVEFDQISFMRSGAKQSNSDLNRLGCESRWKGRRISWSFY